MKARAQELNAETLANRNKAEGEGSVLAAITAMKEPDRAMAKRLHAIIEATAPGEHEQAVHDFQRATLPPRAAACLAAEMGSMPCVAAPSVSSTTTSGW